jgi:peptidyl-prolyl cis-trans isomerase D
MLSLMRKHAGTWMIKVILGAIVIVFVFWGVGSYTSRQSGRVAKVNGTIITLDDYRTAYDNLIEQVRQSFGNNLKNLPSLSETSVPFRPPGHLTTGVTSMP